MPRQAPAGLRSAKMSPRLPISVVMILFVAGGAGGSVSKEPRVCYWCGPLADQVHRSARAPRCPTYAHQDPSAFSTVTCELGLQYCAVVATARPYMESRMCVKLYQDECYQTYCNTTNTWKMICPCRGDLCNGPNTDREHEAFNILIKLSAKDSRTRIKKRESDSIANYSVQDLDGGNETSTIQNDIEQTSESSIDAGTQNADAHSGEQANASDVEQTGANRKQNEASNVKENEETNVDESPMSNDVPHVEPVGAPDIENDASNIEQKNESPNVKENEEINVEKSPASNDESHVEPVGAPHIENDVSNIEEKNGTSKEHEETNVEKSPILNDTPHVEPVGAQDSDDINDVSKVEQNNTTSVYQNISKDTEKIGAQECERNNVPPHVDQGSVPNVQMNTPNEDVQNDSPIPDQIDTPDTKTDQLDDIQPMESVESKQIVDENNHSIEETQHVQASNEIVAQEKNDGTTENTETKSNIDAVKSESDQKAIGVTVSNMKSSESLPTARALQQNASPPPKTEKSNEISTTETTLLIDTSTISIEGTVAPTRGNNVKGIYYSTILILVNSIGIGFIA